MANRYGEGVASTVIQGQVALTTSAWVPLVATGEANGDTTGKTPLTGRRQARVQIKAAPGGAMALAYGAKTAQGTYDAPSSTASSVKNATIMPGNTTWVEPVSDAVQIYGRLVKKKGFTDDSIRAIVTEYA